MNPMHLATSDETTVLHGFAVTSSTDCTDRA
jgi:hypothetical protein